MLIKVVFSIIDNVKREKLNEGVPRNVIVNKHVNQFVVSRTSQFTFLDHLDEQSWYLSTITIPLILRNDF
jgi:hypothetical protein